MNKLSEKISLPVAVDKNDPLANKTPEELTNDQRNFLSCIVESWRSTNSHHSLELIKEHILLHKPIGIEQSSKYPDRPISYPRSNIVVEFVEEAGFLYLAESLEKILDSSADNTIRKDIITLINNGSSLVERINRIISA